MVAITPMRDGKDAIPFAKGIWKVSGNLSTSSSFVLTFDHKVSLVGCMLDMVNVNKITLSSLFIDL